MPAALCLVKTCDRNITLSSGSTTAASHYWLPGRLPGKWLVCRRKEMGGRSIEVRLSIELSITPNPFDVEEEIHSYSETSDIT